MNGRYFLFHIGIGFDAAVVRQVERRASVKRWAGHPLFVWSALTTWARGYDRSHPRFPVRFADGTVVPDGYFAICLNTNPYTYLGNRPLDLSPAATLDRGLVLITFRTLERHAPCSGSIGRGAAGRRAARPALPRPGHRPDATSSSTATGRSRTRSTATTSARPAGSSSATRPDSLTPGPAA